MIYIYDIILNLNEKLIEFFEWEENDNIKYIRKIPLFKINSKTIKHILNKEIKVSNELIDKIKYKTDFNENIDIENYKNITLFCDNKIVIGVLFNEENKIDLISRLLLDEEQEILDFSSRIKEQEINYNVIKNEKQNQNNTLTRKEQEIKIELEQEINILYKENKVDKLNYYFYEYYGKIINDKETVFKKLIESINNNFNDKHIELYEIIKLSYQNK